MNKKMSIKNIISRHINKSLCASNSPLGWANKAVRIPGYNPHGVLIKLGERLEIICKKVANVTYHNKVPFYICGAGVTEAEAATYFQEYFPGKSYERDNCIPILTKIDLEQLDDILPPLSHIIKQYGKLGNKELRKLCNKMREKVKLTDEIQFACIDLALYSNDKSCKYDLFECKLTGDVDAKKADSVVRYNIIIPAIAMGKNKFKFYFAILSNNKPQPKTDGGRRWNGAIAKYLDINSDMILIEEDFFSKILPKEYPYCDFIKHISARIKNLKREKLNAK